MAGKRFVHLATHGLVGSSARPYDASLALTQPEEPSVDDIGFLRLEDIIRGWRGKLSDCELVVLSACQSQTGVGGGDGQMALPWGFFYAGAPAVIASCWQVDDAATAELMGSFYQAMLAPAQEQSREPAQAQRRPNKLEAFTAARKQLRQSHPHPYYWAPFVYLGAAE